MKYPKTTTAALLLSVTCGFATEAHANDAESVFAESFADDTPLDTIPVDIVPVDISPAENGSTDGMRSKSTTPEAVTDGSVARASYNIPIEASRELPPRRPVESMLSLNSLNDPKTRQVISATSVVLGLVLLLAVGTRSLSRRKTKPNELIEVLSRTVVSPKHTLHLVRVHDRMILLAETPNGLTQLESLASPVGESGSPDGNEKNATPLHDNDAERLLKMIRSSDGWEFPASETEPTRLRETPYVA
ncbi:flagellar biosynthetic protein FliO [Planctomycetota bacterium]